MAIDYRRRPVERRNQRSRRHLVARHLNCEMLEHRIHLAGDACFSPSVGGEVSLRGLDADQAPAITQESADAEASVVVPAQSRSADITQRDALLTASFHSAAVKEGSPGGVSLTIQRDPRSVARDLVVRIVGGDATQMIVPITAVIASGKSKTVLRLTPINHVAPEPNQTLTFTFSAIGHRSTTASIRIIDGQPPKFQNQADVHDTNHDGRATAADALQVINALSREGPITLDPSESSSGAFNDVNGDYRVTAADALMIINMLSRDPSTHRSVENESSMSIRDTEADRVFSEMGMDQLSLDDRAAFSDKTEASKSAF